MSPYIYKTKLLGYKENSFPHVKWKKCQRTNQLNAVDLSISLIAIKSKNIIH